jgi:indolepyruvate ferredoxin oxidoreductase beta subunit
VPIQQGVAKYPEGILDELVHKANISVFKAGDIAEELGNSKTMNIVLLGALIKAMDMPGIDWEEVIKSNVKKGFEDINIKAFRTGAEQV